MAIRNSTPKVRSKSPAVPTRRLPAPHDRVKFTLERIGNGDFCIEYYGSHDELIACGAATPELLATPSRGKTRRDSTGNRVALERRKNHLILGLYRSRDDAAQLPGVTSAALADAVKDYKQRFPRIAALTELADTRSKADCLDFCSSLLDVLDLCARGDHPSYPDAFPVESLHRIRSHVSAIRHELRDRSAPAAARPSHLRLVVNNSQEVTHVAPRA
jgi:hypothetical protein